MTTQKPKTFFSKNLLDAQKYEHRLRLIDSEDSILQPGVGTIGAD